MTPEPTIKVLLIAAFNEDAKKPFMPGFRALLIEVTKGDFERGYEFDYAEDRLRAEGYGEPYILFAEEETPMWLMAAFKRGQIKGCSPAEYRQAVAARERVFAEEAR